MDATESLPQGVISFFITYEYLALILVFFISEAGIPLPLPSFALILYAAYLTGQGQGNLFLILVSVVLGMVLGSWLLYTLAARGGRPLLEKYGKYIFLKPERLNRAEAWFNKRGRIAVPLGYLMPGIRLQTVVAAGVFHVPGRTFLCSTIVSAVIWTSIYLCLGVLCGNAYSLVKDSMTNPYVIAAMVGVALAAVVTVLAIKARRHGRGLETVACEVTMSQEDFWPHRLLWPDRERPILLSGMWYEASVHSTRTQYGGPCWARTSDLTLIRRTL
jgi:membrane protein DedA with SNARE-associated domain